MLNISDGTRRDLFIAQAGRMVSRFGDGVALVALTLRVQADGAQPYEIALMLGAGVLPQLLLSGAVGRLADSRDSRRLLVGAGLAEAACAAPLIVTHSFVAITVLVAILGAAVSLESATWSALLPRIVGEDRVAQAIATQQSLQALVMVGGPAIGGLAAGVFGTGVPLAFDTATYVLLAGATALVRTRRTPDPTEVDPGGEGATGGLAVLRADRLLAPLLLGLVLVVLLVGMVDVVLVFLVRVTLHAGGAWYGVAEASWMAGMVGGSVGAGLLKTERFQSWGAIAGAALACAALAPFAVVPAVWMLVPLSIAGGIGNGYAGVAFSSLLVTRTPEAVRGRVSAVVNAALGAAQGLSLLVGGALATVLTPREIYAVGGLLGLAVALGVAAVHGVRATETGRLRPRAQAPDQSLKLP